MEKYYRFAGVELAIKIPEHFVYEEHPFLENFRAITVQDPYRFVFEEVDAVVPPAGRPVTSLMGVHIYRNDGVESRCFFDPADSRETYYMRTVGAGKEYRVETVPVQKLTMETVLRCLATEHLIAQTGGVVFHCAYIQWQGKAILFTAPSGTGKSTQAELWKKYRCAKIVNGDRAAIRVVDGTVTAQGLPFAGSSEYCRNKSFPICAIVYLAQARETTIRQLRGYEAFSKIWEGVTVNSWNAEDVARVSQLVQETAQKIPVFYLACTPDETAVNALNEAIREQEQE
jgi:hypothetical protein